MPLVPPLGAQQCELLASFLLAPSGCSSFMGLAQWHLALRWSIPSVRKVSGDVGVTWPCISHSCVLPPASPRLPDLPGDRPGGVQPGRSGGAPGVATVVLGSPKHGGHAGLLSKAGASWLMVLQPDSPASAESTDAALTSFPSVI